MAVEKWIDALVDVAGSVKSHMTGNVRAYYVFKRTEIPEDISVFPSAITYGEEVHPKYSDSGPNVDIWSGVTEFHLFPDLKKANFPEMQRYFGKIRNAFAAKRRLGGLVDHMVIAEGGIVFSKGAWGSEVEHHILVVHWEVKENVTAEITLGQ